MRTTHRLCLAPILALTLDAGAALAAPPPDAGRSGKEIYRDGCAACHGADGRGNPPSVVGFETPLPDFTDCRFATPETDADWMAVAHDGGTVRAFDRRMPAFGQALSDAELQRVIRHLRGFCADRAWPRGELNFPRPLVTEKAFPENETVIAVAVDGGESASVGNTFIYERRLGARSQLELSIPLEVQRSESGSWQRGLGDAAFAVKHALFHSIDSGTIVSPGGEIIFPTGKENEGLGSGAIAFEPFVAVGQMMPSDGFVQIHAGVELPSEGAREAFVRSAVGKTFTHGRFGRSWSPIVEVTVRRELADDEATLWDVIPQMQVSLSRRQHVLVSAGLQVPVTGSGERGVRLLTYFLWDWFDGGLFAGW